MANSARYLWEQAPEWGVAALAFAIAVGALYRLVSWQRCALPVGVLNGTTA